MLRGIRSKYLKESYLFLYVPCLNISRSGLVRIVAVKISRLCVFTAAAGREEPRGRGAELADGAELESEALLVSIRERRRSSCTVSFSSGCLSSVFLKPGSFQLSGSRRNYMR